MSKNKIHPKRQIKVYHPNSSEPVGIMPDMLAHYEARGWTTEKPKRNSSNKAKPKTQEG